MRALAFARKVVAERSVVPSHQRCCSCFRQLVCVCVCVCVRVCVFISVCVTEFFNPMAYHLRLGTSSSPAGAALPKIVQTPLLGLCSI